MHVVIIGGGIAGTTVAQELRRTGSSADITILDQEPHPLYSKVLLARYITSEMDRERLFLKRNHWYEENKIELISGVRVTRVDTVNAFVETSDGRELPYDALVVATGQEPLECAETLHGIVYLRNLGDAELIKDLISKFQTVPESQRRMVIFGGSFIAMEYIHIAQALNIPTSIVLRSGGFWAKTLCEDSQAQLVQEARTLGMDVYTGMEATIVGTDEVEAVVLEDGTRIDCAIVAVGYGLKADLSWLEHSGFSTGKGLKADATLSVCPGVWAAGDICEFQDTLLDVEHTIANWNNALEQGRYIAHAIMGENKPFVFVSAYATRIGSKEIIFIGDTRRAGADQVRCLQTQDAVIECFDRDGRTIGAVLIGSAKERIAITQAISQKKFYEHNTSS